MSKSYRAKVTMNLAGAPRREYRRILDVVSKTILERPETAGALLFGSEKPRRVDLILTVESNSSSAAESKIDTFIRRIIYAIDPHSGVRTHKRATVAESSVTKELTRA